MRKKRQWILLLVSLTFFLALRIVAFTKKKEPLPLLQNKPYLPEAMKTKEIKNHFTTQDEGMELFQPWLQMQHISKINQGMMRDFSMLQDFCEGICKKYPDLSQEAIVELLIEKLKKLQSQLPFIFPENLYNVLCISESPDSSYSIHQRLYLGESALGFPLHVDVRVYDLSGGRKLDEIIQSFISLYQDDVKIEPLSEGMLVKGKTKKDYGHGFGIAQMDRGMFFYPILQNEKLYVVFSEGSWDSFKEYLPIFQAIKKISGAVLSNVESYENQ